MSVYSLWALLAIAHSLILVGAQSCSAGYEWSYNQLGRSPCQIMQQAQSVLKFSAPGGAAVFNPPNAANQAPGFCSGAYWLLVSSCADCSGHGYHSWSTWKASCSNPPPHLPQNNGLPGDFQLPVWVDREVNYFINQNAYSNSIATRYGGTPRPPQTGNANPPPVPTSPTPGPNPPPATATNTPAPETPPPNTNTASSPTRNPPDDTNTRTRTGTTTGTSVGQTTAVPTTGTVVSTTIPTTLTTTDSNGDSTTITSQVSTTRSLVLTTVSTTFTTTDEFGQQTVVTSAMPTLVDPSGSGFGDSPGTSRTSAASKKTNVGAIVGGILGALAIIALVVAALLFMRRRRKQARIAPSTRFIKDYNKEYEKYGDDPRGTSPRPFSPAARSNTPSNNLSFVVDPNSQDQLIEVLRERDQDHYRADPVKGHAVTSSLLDGTRPRA